MKKILSFILSLMFIMSIVVTPIAASEKNTNANTKTVKTAVDDPEQFRAKGNISKDFYGGGSMKSTMSTKTKSNFTGKTYTHNSKFDGSVIVNGIDVSVWNNNINWTKVKNAGIKYVFIRVAARGYGKSGTIFDDSMFVKNINGAKAAGIKVGVYFFSQAITKAEARQEANYTLNKIKGYKMDLPVVMDYEYSGGSSGRLTQAKLSKTAATNICMEFLNTIKAAGYTPMLYANYSMLNYSLNKETIDAKYAVWLAHYSTSTSYNGDYTFWQYSSDGKVSGISGRVDMNFWYSAKTLKYLGNSDSKIKMSWTKISNADGYIIYRYNPTSKKYEQIKNIKNNVTTTWTNTKLKSATTYYYKIRSYTLENEKYNYGKMSEQLKVTTDPKKVKTLKVTTSTTKKINLSWSKITGASGYRLYKYSPKKKRYVHYKTLKTNKYQDKKVSKNKTYKYKVRAYRTLNGSLYFGGYSPTLKAKAVKKTLVSMKADGIIKASKVYVRQNAGTNYKKVTKVSKNKKVKVTGYKKDKKGKKWYRISFTKGKKKYSGYISSKYIKIVK
ncbi:SH3 domain-containing protein [Anaerofustis stercorihominis]|nr:GH25 family lysozyme [Anaerofustis stercorihominis]MCQ4795324.1 SH3 domain-containing protein [Anaerofustis stercorihominis]